MFLGMIFLLAFPLILLILKVLFFWNKKIMSCFDRALHAILFNVYIRYSLEAYLELSLSSLIRFKNYTFGTQSEKFLTIFATLIFLAIVAYLLFSLIFLQLRYD